MTSHETLAIKFKHRQEVTSTQNVVTKLQKLHMLILWTQIVHGRFTSQ
jgi:hypothetical protein